MKPIPAALLFGGGSGGSDPIAASSVTYDGTSSGLSSENVQDVIDEVNEKIEELPNPMIYKGTLGTGGTITTLPAASPANEGHVYKVKTEGTYGESIHAKVGDMFISNGTEWTHIPSGDDMVIADEVTYDNTSSALTSENVQDAIDEIKTSLDSVETEAEAAQIPTLTKSQYDALTEAQKTDGTLREVKDYTFDGEIKVVYSKAFGSREYYGKVTDEYYVTDEEKYKTGIKAHVVMDYYSIQTGYHTQKEYFDAQGISSTSNGLIAISNYDPNYNNGRIALFPEPYAGKNQFYPYGYNIQNKNLVVCWNNSTGTGVGETGTPDGGNGSNQRNGYTSFSYNVPIFLTQAEATTYVTTGEGLNKAVNYKNSKKSTVLIRNKEVVGITDSNALPFDGTGSDLSSTNAADAIKEVNSKIPSDIQAEDVGYDNTTSGLTATDVNSAIDEVNSKFDNIEVAAEDVSFTNPDSEHIQLPDNTQGVLNAFIKGHETTDTHVYKYTIIGYGSTGFDVMYSIDGVNVDSGTHIGYYDPAINGSKTYHDIIISHTADSYIIKPGPNISPGFIGSGSFSGNFPESGYSFGTTTGVYIDGAITLTVLPDFYSGASYVNYDNTDSGLEATDVQGAIDEVNDKLAKLSEYTAVTSSDGSICITDLNPDITPSTIIAVIPQNTDYTFVLTYDNKSYVRYLSGSSMEPIVEGQRKFRVWYK